MTSGTLLWPITVSLSESLRPPSLLGPTYSSAVLGAGLAPLTLDLSSDLWPALGTEWGPALLWDPDLLSEPRRSQKVKTEKDDGVPCLFCALIFLN